MPPANMPPQVLRVKRKRTDDPLQALVMETQRRSIKRPRYVFKLQRTEENDIKDDTTILTASNGLESSKPVFKIPKVPTKGVDSNSLKNPFIDGSAKPKGDTSPEEANPELSPQLLDMLNDYLKEHDETAVKSDVRLPKRRQSSIIREMESKNGGRPVFDKEEVYNNSNSNAISDVLHEGDETEDSEYVYDVYYRDKAVSDQWDQERIGYIRYDDEAFDVLDDDGDDDMMQTDDEDSNDENFYRNDYPEDEDLDFDDKTESELESMGLEEPSDDQDDEFDILNNRRRFSKLDFMRSEGLKSMSEDEYERLAAEIDEKPSLWGRSPDGLDTTDSYMDDEPGNRGAGDSGEEDDDTQDFPRNEFFKSDRDDPIAVHRDKIFGKLQHMIERQS